MATQETKPGQLIALEGFHDAELRSAGKALLKKLSGTKAGGVSQWDSSGLFHELNRSSCAEVPSPKTLLMLYAADLAFRLRWEIEPLLAEGKDVMAAPYVETAVAFGSATGLEREWMESLFEFAPAPAQSFRLTRPAAGATGFASHCFRLLEGASGQWKKMAGSKPLAAHLSKLKAIPVAARR